MHVFFGEGQTDKRTNEQTHIGGWVENVTNGQTDKRTVTKYGDGRMEGCFLR